jgi:hypothetical protein
MGGSRRAGAVREHDFDLAEGVDLLRRTPGILRAWLGDLRGPFLTATEGPETWSPFDVVGHLIHGERTDWIPRARQILSSDSETPFPPFDRSAHFRNSTGKDIETLLVEFEELRTKNLSELRDLHLTEADLDRPGMHPQLGPVTLRQLLATWVTHDLSHLVQIARVMAKQNARAVGPWREYLSILNR